MTPPDNETSRDDQRAAAEYIANLVMELALMAHAHRLDILGHILEMARTEAERVVRGSDGHRS
jgi:predicted lipoprotein